MKEVYSSMFANIWVVGCVMREISGECSVGALCAPHAHLKGDPFHAFRRLLDTLC